MKHILLKLVCTLLLTNTVSLLSAQHDAWNQLLQKHVTSTGKVNYAGLQNDRQQLQTYLSQLSSTDLSEKNPSEALAFWINAYNAFTVELILANYPLGSIMELDGGSVWDRVWINLNGKKYSLNDIEHKIIRPQFKDPRIHFAVNCAASSCPPLLNQAYTGARLDEQLNNQTRKFINNTLFNQLDKRQLKLSKIFEWYGEDFGSLPTYISRYTQTTIDAKASIDFLPYDWTLNKQ